MHPILSIRLAKIHALELARDAAPRRIQRRRRRLHARDAVRRRIQPRRRRLHVRVGR